MSSAEATTLILLGHGSTLNPDSSAPTLIHADTLRDSGLFSEVLTAFWKEEPSFREVLHSAENRKIIVVPNFISEGYFCQQVIPRELGLTDWVTELSEGRTIHYCLPVGTHPGMKDLLMQRADEVAPGIPRSEISLIIVGHGTGLNDNSTKAIKDQVRLIQESGAGFAEVLDAYMEEPPLISDWQTLATSPHVVVVPFFIADGLHSYQDIPVMLGIENEPTAAASQREIFRQNPHHVDDRFLYFSGAIGTSPDMARVMLDQIRDFEIQKENGTLPMCPFQSETADTSRPSAPIPLSTPRPMLDHLKHWLSRGLPSLGEVSIQASPVPQQWFLTHLEDHARFNEDPSSLQELRGRLELRKMVLFDANQSFRPLKTSPTLQKGWKFVANSLDELRMALEEIYPGALGLIRSAESNLLSPSTLHEFFGRQTGMYRITQTLNAEQAEKVVEKCCVHHCLRHRTWSWDSQSSLPLTSDPQLICIEPCSLFLGEARSLAKKEPPHPSA